MQAKGKQLDNPFKKLDGPDHRYTGPTPTAGQTAGRTNTGPADIEQLADSVEQIRHTVENVHQHRLEKIERDLRWVIFLLGAQLVGLLGAVAGRVLAL